MRRGGAGVGLAAFLVLVLLGVGGVIARRRAKALDVLDLGLEDE